MAETVLTITLTVDQARMLAHAAYQNQYFTYQAAQDLHAGALVIVKALREAGLPEHKG